MLEPRKELKMTVVAGVDEAPISEKVVAKAIEQARWRKTDLHVVHVTHLPMVYTEVAINWDEVAEAQRVSVWAGLEQAIGGSDVAIERVDLDGYPPDTLVAYANDVDASLLVVGTRGRGDFASLILGSTSHRALHLAECDVLVVKGPREQV
ncbi:MAG TPA: universal stress protein [Acidimicrobiia bacterium]